jgi:hypothetical protein
MESEIDRHRQMYRKTESDSNRDGRLLRRQCHAGAKGVFDGINALISKTGDVDVGSNFDSLDETEADHGRVST